MQNKSVISFFVRLYGNHINLLVQLISFFNMVSFGFITGQPMFYLLAISKASKTLHNRMYKMIRCLFNLRILAGICLAYYLVVLALITTLSRLVNSTSGLLLLIAAMAALIADGVFSVTYNLAACRILNRNTQVIYLQQFLHGHIWQQHTHRHQFPMLVRLAGMAGSTIRW